ncbi:hypothetical protein PENTCL1PPCAC_29301, partial [Pristionchus entomophagus]
VMDNPKHLRAMRGKFKELRKDLEASMRLCKTSGDQYHRGMFSITQLLHQALESIEYRRQFNATVSLNATFNALDNYETPTQPQEVVFLKFARSFTIFMDTLNGFCTISKVLEMSDPGKSLSPFINMPRPKVSTNMRGLRAEIPLKRARLCPVPHDVANMPLLGIPRQVRPNSWTTVPASAVHRFPFEPPVEIKQEEDLFDETLSFSTPIDTQGRISEGHIKTEEEDDLEATPQTQCTVHVRESMPILQDQLRTEGIAGSSKRSIMNHGSHKIFTNNATKPVNYEDVFLLNYPDKTPAQIKDELVKEEPLEPPIADVVKIGAGPSTSRPHDELIELTDEPGSAQLIPTLFEKQQLFGEVPVHKMIKCPVCHEEKANSLIDAHIKYYHKDDYLKWTTKCPESECDFRSVHTGIVNVHKNGVHTDVYYKWRFDQKQFRIPAKTRCPYCAYEVPNLVEFVSHMESAHRRMCSYDMRILKCFACSYTVSHCHQMFIHWLKRGGMCDAVAGRGGCKFDLGAAQKAIKEDKLRLKAEKQAASAAVAAAIGPTPTYVTKTRVSGNRCSLNLTDL